MLANIHSALVTFVRCYRGAIVRQTPQKLPEKPLEIYEFEACPFCRKVRELLSELDLAYICRTCARGAKRNRNIVKEKGGKCQFPYLIDPNTETAIYESEVIIDYLYTHYGKGRNSLARFFTPVNNFNAFLSSAIRPLGRHIVQDIENRAQPEKLIELYSFEACPFCRRVREALCELDLDYYVHNVAKGSKRRKELGERGGKVQAPYLIDANTNTEMYESQKIIDYLYATYSK